MVCGVPVWGWIIQKENSLIIKKNGITLKRRRIAIKILIKDYDIKKISALTLLSTKKLEELKKQNT